MLQGQGWTVAHVGDTRVWRIAGGEIQQLTQDHDYAQPDQRNRLTRAVGLDDLLHVDYLQGEARIGDRFVLTSDGVHGVLPRAKLQAVLTAPAAEGGSPDAHALSARVVEAALAARTPDNSTALALQGHTWTVAHVGDTRAWLLRGGELTQLTQDHALDHIDLRSQLTRVAISTVKAA